MTDTTMLRAIACALWPSLRRNRWRTHTVTRDLSKSNPSGYQAGPRLGTIATAPSASAIVEVHHEEFIQALLYAEDWPGATSHALRLNRTDYDTTIAHATHDNLPTTNDWYHALTSATCRAPFHEVTNRHGTRQLRRTDKDPTITKAVGEVLENIAAAATVSPISEATVDDFLIEDNDIDLDAVQRALATA